MADIVGFYEPQQGGKGYFRSTVLDLVNSK